jgi:hypothetical protein
MLSKTHPESDAYAAMNLTPRRVLAGGAAVVGLGALVLPALHTYPTVLLLGEAWLFSSFAAFRYALIVFVFFHLFVRFYEEPSLESRFGEPYQAYRKAVPRWGFAVRPFPKRSGTTA